MTWGRRVLLPLALLPALLFACGAGDDPTGGPAPPLPAEEGESETTGGALARGETPMGWALRTGVSRVAAHAALEALGVLLPASRYRTDDRLEVTRSAGGEMIAFAVCRRSGDRLVARRGAEGEWTASRESASLRRKIARLTGTVHGSLWESMRAGGAPADLVVRYADIFSWTFDFLTECRDGDRFELLAEALYSGEELCRYGEILAARYEGDRRAVAGILFQPVEGRPSFFAPDGSSLRKIFLRSPLNYRRISSSFSRRRYHPILKRWMPHLGIDYSAPVGTPVVSVGDGRVAFAGRKGGFGKVVEVRHARSYTTLYGHLSRIAKGARRGTRVSQGEVIGYVGSTGLSTAPHLDFRMRRGSDFVNPLEIHVPSADPVPAGERRAFFHTARVALAALAILPDGPTEPGRDPILPALLAGAHSGFLPYYRGLGDRPAP